MTNAALASQLQLLGLTDREAKVYIAALELGASPVQKIAQRAEIPRATVYLILDDLKEQGLVSTYDEGKKTFFAVESPEQLRNLVLKQKAEVEQREQLVSDLMPQLEEVGQFQTRQGPTVKYYEGPQGLKSFLRDIIKAPGEELLNIFSHDDSEEQNAKANISWENIVKKREHYRTQRRAIYTYKKDAPEEGRHDPKFTTYIPYKTMPLKTDINIKGNHVGLIPYSYPIRCIMIEDEYVADSMRLIFNHLWSKFRQNDK